MNIFEIANIISCIGNGNAEWRGILNRELTKEQMDRMIEFISRDDMDFYEKNIMKLSDEEQQMFFLENPDFMAEYAIGYDRMDWLKDEMFRNILRKIKSRGIEIS